MDSPALKGRKLYTSAHTPFPTLLSVFTASLNLQLFIREELVYIFLSMVNRHSPFKASLFTSHAIGSHISYTVASFLLLSFPVGLRASFSCVMSFILSVPSLLIAQFVLYTFPTFASATPRKCSCWVVKDRLGRRGRGRGRVPGCWKGQCICKRLLLLFFLLCNAK